MCKPPKMNLWLILLAAMPLGLLSAGLEFDRYRERVELRGDGSAEIRLEMTVASVDRGEMRIPVAAGLPEKLKIQGFAPSALRRETVNGNHFLILDIPKPAEYPLRVNVSFSLAEYRREKDRLEYRFVNMTTERIAEFSALVVLPEGVMVKNVSSFLPKPKNSGADSPLELTRMDGRRALAISLQGLGLGDTVSLDCSLQKEERSKILMVSMILVAFLYLFSYRDVLKNGKKEEALKKSREKI